MDAAAGRQRLEHHYAAWFEQAAGDFRASNISRLVADMLPPGRVLDVGCGAGALLAELLRRGHDAAGCDASPEMVGMCRRYLGASGWPEADVRVGGVDDLPSDGRFDVAVALDVIEHIEDDVGALRCMRAAVCPGGRIIVSVPAISRLYGPKDVAIGHYRRYDRKDLVKAVEAAGLSVEAVRWWNAIGVAPVWLSVRVLRRRLNEDFRYANRSRAKRVLNRLLATWFRSVENRISPPLGLTLLLEARRPPE
jgi:SAM-dependent methyltransferase